MNDDLDLVLDRIREARRLISQECDNDPDKLVEYYLERQKKREEGLLGNQDSKRLNTDNNNMDSIKT